MKKIILSILSTFLLISCTTNLSKREPYLQAINKQFVLQKDFYIYYFNDHDKYSWLNHPCKLRLGTTTDLGNFSYGLAETVEEKYVGSKNSYVTLEGILGKGTRIKVKRIIEQTTADNCYYFYIITPVEGAFAAQEINPSDIINILQNPPYTKTWSAPPIFDPEAALPLPSDGVWWK